MATWKSAAYDGRYLQLDISESVNVVGNSSTLSWTLTSAGGASTYYTIDTTTVTINGTQVYYKARTAWDSKVFPAKKGSVSGTITVAHDSNGSKTITVGFSTRVYIYGPQEYGGSMTLTTIDRSAPTVTFSTSNVTANGFKISATSSATADVWQYSTNGGSSWTQFSTTASTSASVTITSLSPNTSYTVRVRARRQYNHVYGTSGSSTVKTLGGAVVNSVNTVTADNATVSITINVTVYEASYSNTLVLKNGGTTILTISGLSWSKGTANRTVTLTSAQRTTLLNAMASIKSFTGTVPQGTPLIALRKKKVGINTPEPQAMLDVAGDMRVDGSPLADFVIQQGTSGIWNYRKWKSGTAECWGQYSFTTAISTAWGVLYESGAIALPNFPFTFAEIPHVHISTENSNYAMFVERGSSSSWSTTTNPGKIFAVRPNTVPSATYKVSIYAIGKV